MKISEMFGRKMKSDKIKPEEAEELRKLLAEYDSKVKEPIKEPVTEEKKEEPVTEEVKPEEVKVEPEPVKEEIKVETNEYEKLKERLDKIDEMLKVKAQPEPKPEEVQKSGSEKDTVLPINTVSQYTNNTQVKYTGVK